MAELKLHNIGKKYSKDILAVKDFNLQIEDKEFIVLVGPSGCGKSTVLRMIAGLEEMTEGELEMEGKRMNDVSPKDRDVAFVFQNYALYPHLTVYQNMAFGLKMRKFSKEEIKKRVNHAAELLGLEPYLQRKPRSLSGGQCQRVALGRAIVRDAKVFLMDEPLSNLDAKLRVQMRSEITKLHQRLGTTTIYVTHDQTEALTMASRLVVMNEGVIQQIGMPKDVYEKPANVFVAGFIGSPGMNFFTGTVDRAGRVDLDDSSILIGEDLVNKLEKMGYVNKKVIMGIRPEDLYVVDSYQEDKVTTRVEVKVDILEKLGAETILHGCFDHQPLVARIDPQFPVELGETIQLVIDLNKIHFFNPHTEERLNFRKLNEVE